MRLKITSKDFKVTEGIEQKISSQLIKIEKFVKDDTLVDVVLKKTPNGFNTEIVLNYKGYNVKIEDTKIDLYDSMDAVADKLVRKLKQYKEQTNHKKHSKESIKSAWIDVVEDKSFEEKRVVKRKHLPYKPMFEEEAFLQMELLKHDFFVFLNAETETVSVVYKRKDGDYGIIES